MTYDEVPELHLITPVANLPSILEHGVLSNHLARRLVPDAVSVARADIQEGREGKRVPGGGPLHSYANLYFHARNPMMYLRRDEHEALCVLSVHKAVLTLEDVVVTDQNAASDYARFSPSPDGLRLLDRAMVYAEDWRHGDKREYFRHRSIKCAEALVPDRVRPEAVRGAYVSCRATQGRIQALAPEEFKVKVSPNLFFQP